MSGRNRRSKEMPDVPDIGCVDSLCEIFSGINFAAYYFCYVRVCTQLGALQTEVAVLREQGRATKNQAQIDVFICRAHLAAFFWQLQHVFESIGTAFTRGRSFNTSCGSDCATARRAIDLGSDGLTRSSRKQRFQRGE
jgi:hypothetical protein